MIEFRIPVKTRSLNQSFRGDWRPRAAEAKKQRNAAMAKCPKWPGGPLLHVRLTRVSKGTLDFQNLAGALKHAQDGIASRLKIDDASPLVEWHYAQAKGEAEVVVQMWTAGEDAPHVPTALASKAQQRHQRKIATAQEKTDKANSRPSGLRYVSSYTPPRSKPVDAAKEAEETFAPAPRPCLDPDKMHGAGDGFPGSDYD